MSDGSKFNRRAALKVGAAITASGAIGWWPAGPAAAERVARPAPQTALAASSLAQVVLNRLAYGPRPGAFDFDTWAALPGGTEAEKLASFVEWQINPDPAQDPEYLPRRAAAQFQTLDKSLSQLWTDHVRNATGANANNLRLQPAREVRADTLLRAVYSQWQLREVLTAFWHNHFSVYAWDGNLAAVFAHYDRDVIRAHALGNFRQLLEAVARSPAMLYFLDNATSQGAQFNENYARELCELHALGAENYLGVQSPLGLATTLFPPDGAPINAGYVDNDVYEVARCLTGWRVNDGTASAPGNDGAFLYWSAWHDRASKFVLGRFFLADGAPEADGLGVLDLLAYHPGTARFVCRKLCRRLVGDDPPPALVDAAAQVFLDQRLAADQLKQVARFIALSAEFQAAWGEKLKTPAEAAIGFLRATRAEYQPNAAQEFTTTNPLWTSFDAMGQPLFGRRSPDGYPDTRAAWNGTTSFLYRWRFANDLIEDRLRTTLNGAPALITSADLLAQTPAGLTTPTALVDFWTARIFGAGHSLPPATRAELLKMMSGSYPNAPHDNALTAQQITDRLKRMVALLLMAPDFQRR